jgi:hypothetical protein
MPKYPYKQVGTGFREGRNDINQSLIDIESDIKELGAGATQAFEAADEANTQALYANDRGDYADERGNYSGQEGDYAKAQGDYSKSQGDYGKAQGDYAQVQGDYAKSVADTNKNQWKLPVANFAAIATTYPTPLLGDRVMTLDTNKEYRYQNGAWEFVNQYSSSAVADIQAKLSETGKQTQSLSYGLNVVSGDVNSPATVQIQGRTLVSLGNTPLNPDTNYVLADKKTKVIVDGTTYTGVSKFRKGTGTPNDRATVIRISNFENKVFGSTLENPHIAKYRGGSVLDAPSVFTSEFSATDIVKFQTLNGTYASVAGTNSSDIGKALFSFDIISAVERNIGTIPKTLLADKVQWVKDNSNRLTANWWGFGSSVGGNKAKLTRWLTDTSSWYGSPVINTLGVVSKVSMSPGASNAIDTSGFVHFLAYAEPSDGTTASTINTDYIELEIELKPTANFQNPKVALYEVQTQAHYDAILTTWLEAEVINRYPIIQGVQHIQNPAIIAEGENLLPPFYEWSLDSKAEVVAPYKLKITGNGTWSFSWSPYLPVIVGQSYNFSLGVFADTVKIHFYDKYRVKISDSGSKTSTFNITAPANAVEAQVQFLTLTNSVIYYENPMLNLGSTAKPFAPRDPSYLFPKVKLGQIGTMQDSLYADDGVYKVRKAIEKDLEL